MTLALLLTGAALAQDAASIRALIERDAWREALDAARAYVAASPGDADATSALGEPSIARDASTRRGARSRPSPRARTPPPGRS